LYFLVIPVAKHVLAKQGVEISLIIMKNEINYSNGFVIYGGNFPLILGFVFIRDAVMKKASVHLI